MPACILYGDVYSAAVCWRGVELCVLMFCIVIICGVEYTILEMKQYFIHLFILLVCTKNMDSFKSIHMSAFWGLFVLFLLCYECIRRSVPYLVCVVPRWMCLC
jgi:hypothetical protein